MDVRKWEDLPVDCLVDIFARVGLKSLIDWVPYVCKSWHKATLIPQCWQSLILPEILGYIYWPPGSDQKSLVKFVIRRSHGTVKVVVFQKNFSLNEEVIMCIAEGCPSLKWLALSSCNYKCRLMLSDMICKWKDLEALHITTPYLLGKVVPQISIHCNKFISLSAIDIHISRNAASAITKLNIQFLCLKRSKVGRWPLRNILKGCKKLVHLDVSYCIGFVVDDKILNLAAHLATFNFEGSSLSR